MRSGLLRKRLVYQTPVLSDPNGNGQLKATSWTTVGTYWGQVRSPTVRESANAQQLKASASHVLTLRYQGFAFDPTGRFLYGTRQFQISGGVNVDERNREVTVFATEVIKPVTSP